VRNSHAKNASHTSPAEYSFLFNPAGAARAQIRRFGVGAMLRAALSLPGLVAEECKANDGLSVSFDISNVDDLPYKENSFNLVVCNHVMNDLRDPTPALN
jgi:Methyltransferase domain